VLIPKRRRAARSAAGSQRRRAARRFRVLRRARPNGRRARGSLP